MSKLSTFDVLTAPAHRRGPSALGLAVLGVLFLVPGLLAPNGYIQLVGALWLAFAVAAAAFDLSRDLRAIE